MAEPDEGQMGVIVGANGGVGYATFEELCGSAKMLYAVTRGKEFRGTVSSKVRHLQADIRNHKEVEQLFSTILAENRVDFIVNCVGVGYFAPLGENYQRYWEEIFQTNVIGLMNLLSVVSSQARDLKHFLHVSSLAAHRPSQTLGNIAYTSAKVACIPIINHFRAELREQNNFMKVSSISPGYISGTGFGDRFFDSAPHKKSDLYARFKGLAPCDVAQLIAFMLKAKAHVEISEIIVRPVEQPD